jgi:hypothetical protein
LSASIILNFHLQRSAHFTLLNPPMGNVTDKANMIFCIKDDHVSFCTMHFYLSML